MEKTIVFVVVFISFLLLSLSALLYFRYLRLPVAPSVKAAWSPATICTLVKEDGYANKVNPSASFGSNLWLKAGYDASTLNLAYFKFDPTQFTPLFMRAYLRFQYKGESTTQTCDTSFVVKKITSSWAEQTLTWNNKPAMETSGIASKINIPVTGTLRTENIDITSMLRSKTIPYGLVLHEARYRPEVCNTNPTDPSCFTNLPCMMNIIAKEASTGTQPAAQICFDTCYKHPDGDANCDGQFTTADFELWLSLYLGNTNVTCNGCSADFNDDRKVDLKDFEIWRRSRFP